MNSDYIIIVTIAAIIYAIAARVLQQALINQKEVKEIQEESKQLSDELKKAKEANDKARMEEATKKQLEFLPKMNKMMFAQFKPMIFIIIIYIGMTWFLAQNDPFLKDDIVLNLSDMGKECDKIAGDGLFTACLQLNNGNPGVWVLNAKAMNGNTEIGYNSTTFLYEETHPFDRWTKQATGEPVGIETDKDGYLKGENATITVTAPAKANKVILTIDNGTEFNVDLPFAIPVL